MGKSSTEGKKDSFLLVSVSPNSWLASCWENGGKLKPNQAANSVAVMGKGKMQMLPAVPGLAGGPGESPAPVGASGP